MATTYVFGGRTVKLPGAYSTIESGIKNPPVGASYGNIMIVDTGSGANYGGGSGIAGALASGKDAVYAFDNLKDFQDFHKGGLWYLLANPLFKPYKFLPGVSQIYFVRAAETTSGVMTFAPTGGTGHGGTFVFHTRDEGVIANGSQDSGNVLRKGYAFTMHSGEVDTDKFVLKFWRGTYVGAYTDALPYNGIPEADSPPQLLLKSIEFDNMQDLVDWAEEDYTFNSLFYLHTKTVSGTGAIDSADLAAITGNQLATGGTETYSSTHLDTVLENIKELDFSYFLCDKEGDNAQGVENTKIFNHINQEAKFQKQMVVGGGTNSTKFTQANGSIPTAQYYDSDTVVVVHGGVKKVSQSSGTGFREFTALYKAALVLGRLAGLEPQVPITFKPIDIDGESHRLTEKEQEQCLDNGVLATVFDPLVREYVVLQGVNSLQKNRNLINEDGTTHSVQLKRIISQINKELVVNARQQLLTDPEGVNRATLSTAYLRDWTISYLQSRTSTDNTPNLLLSFKEVTVDRVEDAYFVRYKIAPNSEISKLFFIGVVSEI